MILGGTDPKSDTEEEPCEMQSRSSSIGTLRYLVDDLEDSNIRHGGLG